MELVAWSTACGGCRRQTLKKQLSELNSVSVHLYVHLYVHIHMYVCRYMVCACVSMGVWRPEIDAGVPES